MIRRLRQSTYLSASLLFWLLTVSAVTPAQAHNIITEWNEAALDTVRTVRAGTAPASRWYAMLNAAMYDSVNGIRHGFQRRREYALVPPHGAPRRASRRAAAIAAGHRIMSELHPDLAEIFDELRGRQLDRLHSAARARVRNGLRWGTFVAEEVLRLRADDGSQVQNIQPGSNGPGEFRADFTSAQFRNMDPFAIADPTAYISAGPPALTSPEYLAAHHELRVLGDAAYVNAEYEEIFRFWRGGGGSARPPGEWVKIAITAANQHGVVRNLSETARLMTLLTLALGDSTTVAWGSKFDYHFWRPTTAIRNADIDGNPDTIMDANWSPRNGSIGGSPEHPSGQSTYAGAGAAVLAGFFCSDNVSFQFEGDDAIAGPRSFARFSDAAREAGRARIFAGIHFEFSNQAGQAAGRSVAAEVLATSLRKRSVRRHSPDCFVPY